MPNFPYIHHSKPATEATPAKLHRPHCKGDWDQAIESYDIDSSILIVVTDFFSGVPLTFLFLDDFFSEGQPR